MLAAFGMAALVSFHSACRFFSHHVWDPDRFGLAVARLIVERLLPTAASIAVAVDDHIFRRWGEESPSRVLDRRRRRPGTGYTRPRQSLDHSRDRGGSAVPRSPGVPADPVRPSGRRGHAQRRSIEPAKAIAKQILGVGQDRNRVPRAVAFGFLAQTVIIAWYATLATTGTTSSAAEP